MPARVANHSAGFDSSCSANHGASHIIRMRTVVAMGVNVLEKYSQVLLSRQEENYAPRLKHSQWRVPSTTYG